MFLFFVLIFALFGSHLCFAFRFVDFILLLFSIDLLGTVHIIEFKLSVWFASISIGMTWPATVFYWMVLLLPLILKQVRVLHAKINVQLYYVYSALNVLWTLQSQCHWKNWFAIICHAPMFVIEWMRASEQARA